MTYNVFSGTLNLNLTQSINLQRTTTITGIKNTLSSNLITNLQEKNYNLRRQQYLYLALRGSSVYLPLLTCLLIYSITPPFCVDRVLYITSALLCACWL